MKPSVLFTGLAVASAWLCAPSAAAQSSHCQVTLEDVNGPGPDGISPFAIISAAPSLSLKGCQFIAFYQWQSQDEEDVIVQVKARYWHQADHNGAYPVLHADSLQCPAMASALGALEDIQPPANDFPKPGQRRPEGVRASVMVDGTSLTFRSTRFKQKGNLTNGFAHFEFSTIDFPDSPISRWLENELPKLEKCWQPGENEEEYPIENGF